MTLHASRFGASHKTLILFFPCPQDFTLCHPLFGLLLLRFAISDSLASPAEKSTCTTTAVQLVETDWGGLSESKGGKRWSVLIFETREFRLFFFFFHSPFEILYHIGVSFKLGRYTKIASGYRIIINIYDIYASSHHKNLRPTTEFKSLPKFKLKIRVKQKKMKSLRIIPQNLSLLFKICLKNSGNFESLHW